ncbi:DDE-type integrase/transposase/recombinase [Alicyclobacillus curvatus]|nr:DDE-type integrase/transposase/recombinase [Alicyclobacillus curvatus]
MSKCDFSHGTRFMVDGKEYIVRKESVDEVEVTNTEYQKVETWKKRVLLAAWEQRRLVFRGGEELPSEYVDISTIEEPLMKQAMSRYSVLVPILSGAIPRNQIREYACQLDPKVSVASIYRWEKLWKKHQDIRYLVTRRVDMGPRQHRTHPEVMSIIERTIKDFSYSGEEVSDEMLYSEVLLRLDELNDMREDPDKLPDISNSTFRRRKRELLNENRANRAKYGTHLSKLMGEGVKQEVVASRPLERVELDSTPVDILMLDHGTMKAVRGHLVYAIDAFGSMPLGFKVTLDAPTSEDIKECLLHCMRPKTYVQETFPRVEHEWIAYGKPRTLVVDNASINNSLELEDICDHLGIRLLFAKVGAGNQKGRIERGFRTLNQKWLHATSGTTKSNVIQRAQYDSEGKACVTPQTFVYMAHIAVIDLVAHAFNKRVGATPHEKWLEGWASNPHLRNPLPHSFDELQFLLVTGRETRKLRNIGVEVLGENYNSPDLMQLRAELKKNGHGDRPEVKVRFTTSDMRSVYIYDPYKETYIEADAQGLARRGLDTSLPVPSFALEQILETAKNNQKQVNPRARGRAQRQLAELSKEDKRRKSKAKRVYETKLDNGETPVPQRDIESFAVPGRAWSTPPDADSIQNIYDAALIEDKEKKPVGEHGETLPVEVSVCYDIEDEELDEMEISFK